MKEESGQILSQARKQKKMNYCLSKIKSQQGRARKEETGYFI